MFEQTIRVNYLYDFYAPLLTERQGHVLRMYYCEDLSLGEIAAELNISRQAVYDILRRTVKQMESMEEKLGLYRKFQERQLDFEEALNIIADAPLAESEKKKIFRLLSRMHYQD